MYRSIDPLTSQSSTIGRRRRLPPPRREGDDLRTMLQVIADHPAKIRHGPTPGPPSSSVSDLEVPLERRHHSLGLVQLLRGEACEVLGVQYLSCTVGERGDLVGVHGEPPALRLILTRESG